MFENMKVLDFLSFNIVKKSLKFPLQLNTLHSQPPLSCQTVAFSIGTDASVRKGTTFLSPVLSHFTA